MRFFSVLLALVVAAFLYAWVLERDWLYALAGSGDQAEQPAQAVTEDDGVSADGRIKVVALKSRAQNIESAVVLRGQTEAVRQVDVRAETSSTIVSEPLRKGSYVQKGAELCVLDPGTRGASLAEAKARKAEAIARKSEAEARVPESKARLAEAEARLEEALTNENVAVKLSVDGFAADTRVKNSRAAVAAARAGVEAAISGVEASQSGIQSADAGIESAEAAVAAANKEIERLTIRAPFEGLLESDTAELGSLLQPGSLCATIIQLDPIKLVAFVPETEVARIQTGALAGARLAGAGEVTGRVNFLSRSADPTTRTFRVEIEVPNPDQSIRDGQTAEILIQAEGESAHLLPSSALTLNDEGALGLRLVDDSGVVKFNPVEILRDTQDGVWLGGLPDLADVIVVGQEYVTQGVAVLASYRENDQ